LGFAEVGFLSITALITDQMLKSAEVRLLGIETTGNENLQIRVAGGLASVTAALAAAESRALDLGARIVTRALPQPDSALDALLNFPDAQNPLFGGRDQFLPSDFPQPGDKPMNANEQALGIIETQGLTAILEATDVMLKAANVTLVGKEKIGAAYVTVMIRGDVAAVQAAIDAGAAAVKNLGKLVASHVIPRPHHDLLALLPK
jgi:carbon dioxide concentrating mechanism protein CcmO